MTKKSLTAWEAGTQISRSLLHWGPDGYGTPAGPITFGFRMSTPGYDVPDADIKGTFSQLSAPEMAAAESAMRTWAGVANITFSEVNAGGYTDNATILFANYYSTTDGAGAFGLAPGGTAAANFHGDVFFNTNSVSTTSIPLGGFSYQSILHEIGHALGLEHPGYYNAGPGVNLNYANDAAYIEDSGQYSLMSYFEASETGANHIDPLTNAIVYASTPLLHDIVALQRLYGVNLTTRTGDTVYGFHSNTGAPYAINASTNQVVYSIWDAGGIDRLDASGYSQDQRIDLRQGAFSDIGALTKNVSIAFGVEIENASGGSGHDSITGNDGDNILNGLAGSDTLIGLGGADILYGNEGKDTLEGGYGFLDTLFGGADDDTYIINDFDIIHESSGNGHDTVISSIRWVLSNTDELEDLALTGTDNINGFGNALDNNLTGNSANNYLDGGEGYDSLAGGAGNDSYALASTVVINGANTWDKVTENAGGGIDTVYASADVGRYTYQLEANVENLVATGVSSFRLWGNDLANALTGNNAANELLGFDGTDTLNGKAGFDTLAGGLGSDTYILDDLTASGQLANFIFDAVIEAAGAGTDSVLVRSLADPNKIGVNHYTLGANVENGTITGTDVFNLAGNELDNILTGNAAANTLAGSVGGDTFYGNGGVDTLIGGEGDDKYYLTDLAKTSQLAYMAYDTVTEGAAGGIDVVYITALDNPDTLSSVETYKLGANIENGVIQGAIAFNLAGNELNNLLAGNDAANVIAGGAGNDNLLGVGGFDTLIGGVGDDVYFLTDLSRPSVLTGFIYDAVREAADDGIDTIVVNAIDDPDTLSGIETYTLGANIENGFIQGRLAFNLAGNALANTLTGNGSSNKLYGKAGADTLSGGAGADVLTGGAGKDTMTGGDGADDFDFNALSDTGKTASTRDRITDFSHGLDDIDLATIDANGSASGNGAFKFLTKEGSAFTGVRGQLSWDTQDHSGTTKDVTIVSGDTNGDKHADFHIELTGLKTLTSSDFVL